MKLLKDMTEAELAELMTSAAKAVEAAFREKHVTKPLFCLVVFTDPKVAQYISNCRREDMIVSMRETADRIERKQDVRR